MDKWKRAVVHLECATDSEHFYDRIKRIDDLLKKLNEGKISRDEFTTQIGMKSRDIRHHGTAVFLMKTGRRYLVTARHVLWDEHSAKREYQEEMDRTQYGPEQNPAFLLALAAERAKDNIFGIVFRVPALDEVMQSNTKAVRSFLMNLGAGTSFTVPYTFSSPDIDLAVVSLDQRDSKFADELLSKGYVPISKEDIGEQPTREGAEVYTIGFPSATALLGQVSQHHAITQWSSSYFSLPSFSFGRVSMLHETLPFYWVDMSVYPGNSGGPIIEAGKMVGIVCGQPVIPVEKAEELSTRIPFGKIIKAKFIAELLSIQEQKDTNTV